MKLNEESITWSISHLFKESDNDLFPRPYELEIINDMAADVIRLCKEIDLTNYIGRHQAGSSYQRTLPHFVMPLLVEISIA